MSAILKKVILMGCTSLFIASTTSGLGQMALAVTVSGLTLPDPTLLAVNRTDRTCFQAQPPAASLPNKTEAILEPLIMAYPPFSVPLDGSAAQAENLKAATFKLGQMRSMPALAQKQGNR